MNKNLLISMVIVVAFGLVVYLSVNSAPKNEAVNNLTEENMNTESENLNENQTQEPEFSSDLPQMQILKEGEGEAKVKSGDTVAVFYTGYLTDGTVFDSNVGGNPFEFTIGAGQVIAGWEVGLVDMKVGEQRRLVLPPAFAYGNQAIGPIPANSTLVFDVELRAIK
jgi:FKBP-type peptidyl-prolyl cis-trans isomerase